MFRSISSSLSSLFLFLILCPSQAQNSRSSCNFFEEQNGLLVVEMESLPVTANWEVSQEIPGYTGSGYIQWTGPQYFNQVGRGPILFNIRINNPGTYVFDWRVAVGLGNDGTRHNDSWLKIKGDIFYAKKGVLFLSPLKPRPICTIDPNFDCPNGSSAGGFFKVFGGNIKRFDWKAQTSDRDAHDVLVRFDSIGTYQIEINARSSFHAIDRLILWNTQNQRAVNAKRLSNRESNCLLSLITSREQQIEASAFLIYPNPAHDQIQLEFRQSGEKDIILRDMLGKEIQRNTTHLEHLSISTSDYQSGIYYIEVKSRKGSLSQKVLIN